MLENAFHAIQSLEAMRALRESRLVYPILMAFHLGSIAAFGGMILMTNLRLLGVAMGGYSVTDLVKGLRPWKHAGLTVIVGCGAALAASKADTYYPNGFFWTKMTLLALAGVHALAFRRSVYGNTEALDGASTMPAAAKAAAISSLLLWTGVAAMGRLIGYWE